jgi:hypothetical protein
MKIRKGLASIAMALFAMGSTAWAVDTSTSASADGSLVIHPILADDTAPAAPAADAAPTGPTTLIDGGLDKVGLYKPLSDLGINITGFAEMGYMYDMTVPRDTTGIYGPKVRAAGDLITLDGHYKNTILLDAVTLNIEKDVDVAGKLQKGSFDYGFKFEFTYGRDAAYYHSDGLLDNNSKNNNGPDDQMDLKNCNVSFGLPIGNGLTIEVGKFDGLLGYEVVDAPTNLLYSHSYQFAYGEMATQTGILANYYLTADGNLQATAGCTRGWNQSTEDNNGAPDFIGQVAWKVTPKLTTTFNLSAGPQLSDSPLYHACSYWETVPELVLNYQLSDQLLIGADIEYGYEAEPVGVGHTGQWYGVAGYGSYTLCKYVKLNARAEWYEDGHGYTVGTSALTGRTFDYYEVTLGLGITPLPDTKFLSTLTIRPEVRCDWADHAVYDNNLDGASGKYCEVTAAIDAFITY